MGRLKDWGLIELLKLSRAFEKSSVFAAGISPLPVPSGQFPSVGAREIARLHHAFSHPSNRRFIL